MMEKFRALLAKKVGGIPVLYLVGFAVIGLGIYAWQTGSVIPDDATAEADPTETDSADGDATGNEQPVFVANPSVNPSSPTDPATVAPIAVDDNDLWLKRTVAWLIQTGQAQAGVAQAAMSKYLNAEPLSYDEGQLRDAAIKQFGLPPEVPTGGTTNAKPARRQFSVFPGTHTVQGESDNTYGELGMLYYGRNDAQTIDLLQATNLEAGHSGPFPVGTKIKIPKYSPPRFYVATSAVNTLSQIARKNTIAQARLLELNPKTKFPVKPGTRVRIL